MYEPAVGTQYMNGSGFIRILVYLIAPEETRRQINVYTGGGGGGVHSNLAARGQNKSEKRCCQITE